MRKKNFFLILIFILPLVSCLSRMNKDMDISPPLVPTVSAVTENNAEQSSKFKTLSEYTEETYAGEINFAPVKGSTEIYSISALSMKDLTEKEDKEEKHWFKRDLPMLLLLAGIVVAIMVLF